MLNPHKLISAHSVFGFILVAMMFFLSGCDIQKYPMDHEQLSAEERVVIRFSHIVGENTPKGLAARKFASLVKERTNGFVEVQVFPNGYLYRDGEELEALVQGDIQMVAPAMSKLSTIVPEWEVIDLPFAFRNSKEVREYLEGEKGKSLLHLLEKSGYHPLGVWDNGFKQMTNSIRPLVKPDDFIGLKFRIMPSSVIQNQFQQLGATTHSNSFNEVYKLLEKKQMNAQENTFSNIVSKHLYSLQEYLTVSNHGYLGYVVLMNQDFWNQLPEDIQTIIQKTMDEVTKWEIERAEELNNEGLREVETCNCIDIHYLTEEEKQKWQDALMPVYKNFADRFGADYIKSLPKNK